ncbi:MAG: homoserine kinase [Christensenellales bacterium]|jgi:homoserine kinase
MMRIMVPATTANLGAGFDSFGMALSIYNVVEFETAASALHIDVQGSLRVPVDERNLLYQSIKQTLDDLGVKTPGLRIRQHNYIPVTRGLGSSAACRVAGVMIADMIAEAKLSREEIVGRAARMEGHPDNVAAAVMGGFTIAGMDEGQTLVMKMEVGPSMKCCLLVPGFPLQTKKARFLLPDKVTRQAAVYNIGRAAVFAAAMATGRYEYLWEASKDALHQPYRKQLVPGFDEIVLEAQGLGARAAFLSGAGPSIVALVDREHEAFEQGMRSFLQKRQLDWKVLMTEVCQGGAWCEPC